jgi:peptidyl-tRNA hydrolase
LKIGIGLSEEHMRPSENYVLKPFESNNKQLIRETIVVALDAVNYYLKYDPEKAMNRYN